MADVFYFRKGQIVDAHMAGMSVTKTADSFGVT